MAYEAETWTLTTHIEQKQSAAQHNMERNILNITYKDRKTNKWVRDQTKVMDIMEIIKNTSAAERIIDGVYHRQFGYPQVAKEIEEGNEKVCVCVGGELQQHWGR